MASFTIHSSPQNPTILPNGKELDPAMAHTGHTNVTMKCNTSSSTVHKYSHPHTYTKPCTLTQDSSHFLGVVLKPYPLNQNRTGYIPNIGHISSTALVAYPTQHQSHTQYGTGHIHNTEPVTYLTQHRSHTQQHSTGHIPNTAPVTYLTAPVTYPTQHRLHNQHSTGYMPSTYSTQHRSHTQHSTGYIPTQHRPHT